MSRGTPRPTLGKRPPAELLAVCIDRAGYGKGLRVAGFVHSWAIAEGELGDSIGIEAYADWWRDRDRRTAYRRLSEFREVFPELGRGATPSDLIAWRPVPEARARRSRAPYPA